MGGDAPQQIYLEGVFWCSGSPPASWFSTWAPTPPSEGSGGRSPPESIFVAHGGVPNQHLDCKDLSHQVLAGMRLHVQHFKNNEQGFRELWFELGSTQLGFANRQVHSHYILLYVLHSLCWATIEMTRCHLNKNSDQVHSCRRWLARSLATWLLRCSCNILAWILPGTLVTNSIQFSSSSFRSLTKTRYSDFTWLCIGLRIMSRSSHCKLMMLVGW